MGDELLDFIGIARRAGKLKLGADPVKESIRSGKAKLIMSAADISDNTLNDIETQARSHGVELIRLKRTKDEIHFRLGKYTAVMSLEDKGFINKIKMLNDVYE